MKWYRRYVIRRRGTDRLRWARSYDGKVQFVEEVADATLFRQNDYAALLVRDFLLENVEVVEVRVSYNVIG